MIFIKTNISASICGSVDHHNNVQALLKAVDEQFKISDKAQHLNYEVLINEAHPYERCALAHYANGDIAAQLKTLEIN
jgi:hypothetical protein